MKEIIRDTQRERTVVTFLLAEGGFNEAFQIDVYNV